MKLLFDQNISYRILKQLSPKFIDSSAVKSEGLIDFDDFQIWNFAKKNEFTVVSMDSDFNDLMSVYGPPPKLIWLRFGNKGTKEIAHILDSIYDDLVAFHENDELGVFEVFLTSTT